MKAIDQQVGGDHYKGFKIQPWEFCFKNDIPFHKGNIINLIMHYDLPTGKGLEDLEKIKHEIDLIIEFQGWSEDEAPVKFNPINFDTIKYGPPIKYKYLGQFHYCEDCLRRPPFPNIKSCPLAEKDDEGECLNYDPEKDLYNETEI